jgi:trigger factor
MQVTKEQVEPCTVALDIQVEPEIVSRAYERAYKDFGKFTNVPGFRPGKAPRAMLERYVNQEKLRERVMELVATPAYREALEQEKISPYLDPEVEFSDLADGQPWQFKALVPTAPQITLGDLKGISVERPVYQVTDEDVNQQIDSLRGEHARLEKVEGRGVEPEDVIIAEMKVTVEGEEPPAEPRRTLIRLGDNIPGFDEAVLGQQVDEERTFKLTYPEDYQDPEKAGKTADFEVKIASISRRVLPELTDEWVKGAMPFQTVEELKDTVRKAQEGRMKDLSDRIAEGRIVEEIIKRSTIEFPGAMTREEMQEEAEQLGRELQQRGLSYEQYLQMSGMTEEQHQARMAQTAEERVKTTLVLRELAKNENIEVTGDEMAEEFARIAATNSLSDEDTRRLIRDERRRTAVANTIIRRKLRARLFEMAEIKDVEAKPEGAAA